MCVGCLLVDVLVILHFLLSIQNILCLFLPFCAPGGWPLRIAPRKLLCLPVFHLVWLMEELPGAKSIYYSSTFTPLLLATILPVASFFLGTRPVWQPLFLSDSPLYRSGNFILSSCPCRTTSSIGCLPLLILGHFTTSCCSVPLTLPMVLNSPSIKITSIRFCECVSSSFPKL